MKVKIRTPSRLHLTLIDLNGSIGRIDGGIGFALEEPYVEVIGSESDSLKVTGDAINLDRFKSVAERLSSIFNKKVEIRVLSDYTPHVGLGSGTQISLAVAQIYNKLFNLNLSVRELAKIVRRGGTSGIGVSVFEFGGFILDGGHSIKVKKGFLPSSASTAPPPPVLSRLDFPDWKVVVVIPNLSGLFGKMEVDLFKKHCPIPVEDVRKISHIILMKILPSIVEVDLDSFGSGIWEIQHLGFKKVEINQYGDLIWDFITTGKEYVPAIGMSSTGPAVYAITDESLKDIVSFAKEYFAERCPGIDIIKTRGRNKGAEIKVEKT